MPATVRWSPEMLTALARVRGAGVPLYVCAERIGVSYPTAVVQARKMGLHGRMNSGRKSGAAVVAEGRRA